MNKQPKVSIITTCYNREKTIGEAIESVLAQDYPNIEYIIVDGASTDNSVAVIRKYEDNLAKIISEPDKGVYDAINKGIKLATGDIFGLMHSDDIFYSTDRISKWVEAFVKEDADIVYGNGLFVDQEDMSKVVRDWISGPYSKSRLKRGWLPLHPTVYIKRSCFEEAGLYDDSFKIAADSDFLIRYLYTYNFKVHYVPEYIVRMRMGGLSTDPKKMKKKWAEDIRMYKKNHFSPYTTLALKIMSKIPQFVKAKI